MISYTTIMREHGGMAHARYIETTVGDLKAGGVKGTIETADGLGCLTVILAADAEERGGFDLLTWLEDISTRTKRFNVMTIGGRSTTSEAVAAWKESRLTRAVAAGEA